MAVAEQSEALMTSPSFSAESSGVTSSRKRNHTVGRDGCHASDLVKTSLDEFCKEFAIYVQSVCVEVGGVYQILRTCGQCTIKHIGHLESLSDSGKDVCDSMTYCKREAV